MASQIQPLKIAAKYHGFPVAESLTKKIICPATPPVKAKTILEKASLVWKDNPFEHDTYAPLTDSEHAEFTADLLKAVKRKEKAPVVKYPVTVKTTKNTRLKSRSKFFIGGKDVQEIIASNPTEAVSTNDLSTTAAPVVVNRRRNDVKETPSKEEVDKAFLKKMANLTLIQRSKKDSSELALILRELDGFKAIPDIVIEQMCNVGSILYAPEDSFICDYSMANQVWYCVISGSLLVEIKKEGSTKRAREDMFHRHQLGPGEHFGTLQLTAASAQGMVTALDDSIIFRIDAHDYFRASTFANEKAQKAAFVKIKSLPLFEGISADAFKSFVVMMILKTYKQGDIICKQGSDVKKAALVVDGICSVKAELKNGTKISLGQFKAGDYFGEQLWIKDLPNVYTFSVTALSPTVNITYFSHNSALQSKMEASEYTTMSRTPEILEKTLESAKIEKIETAERKRQIVSLLREKKGDPRILTIEHCQELYQRT